MNTRHPISWSELAGAPVGVWGLGVEGRANLRKLRAIGAHPTLVDDNPPADYVDVATRLDAGGLEALARCRVVVKTPGISRYRDEVTWLEDAGVPVVGGLGLWLEEADRSRVVCVTGTKGKSTTVSVMGHLLDGFGARGFVGGNLGSPPWDPDIADDSAWWVIETSSYQCTDVASSPEVVAVTSLFEDHLTWHGDAERYFDDKLSICSQPGARLTVANGLDDRLRARDHALGPTVQWVTADLEQVPHWITDLGVRGDHNVTNALVAQACLVALGVPGADDEAALRRASRGFEPLDSRLTMVGDVGGVTFVDDSLSTNVLSTLAALRVFDGRAVALLAGGLDRNIDYGPLAGHLRSRLDPTLLVALPTSGARLADLCQVEPTVAQLDVARIAPSTPSHEWLVDAAVDAYSWAKAHGGVVLLSPAAASFDHFVDYRERARVFTRAVDVCRQLPD